MCSAVQGAAVVEALADEPVTVDATGMHYRDLNARLRELALAGAREIVLTNVNGQRYLGTNLQRQVRLDVHGVPGQDLGAFMDGPTIVVHGNAQDGCGDTMNAGTIVIHGSAGDILGLAMRGGKIFVRGNVGYRVGIHMKEYEAIRPVIVIGGTAQHFLGEYMAGGILIVLGTGLRPGQPHPSRHVGTGMHGGVIYLRGTVDPGFLGKEVGAVPLEEEDRLVLEANVGEYAAHMGLEAGPLLEGEFTKLVPLTKRPYGRLYAY